MCELRAKLISATEGVGDRAAPPAGASGAAVRLPSQRLTNFPDFLDRPTETGHYDRRRAANSRIPAFHESRSFSFTRSRRVLEYLNTHKPKENRPAQAVFPSPFSLHPDLCLLAESTAEPVLPNGEAFL